jgi:hypothetical protein
VTAITIVRINVLLNVDFTDLPYSMHDAAFWSVAEPAIAIINCCIATLRPLIKIISPARIWSSNKGSTKDRVGYSNSANIKCSTRNKAGMEHDEYPLTQMEDDSTEAVATGRSEGMSGAAKSDTNSVTSNTMSSGQRLQ